MVDGGGRVVAAQREQRGSFGRRRTIWHLDPAMSSSPKDQESQSLRCVAAAMLNFQEPRALFTGVEGLFSEGGLPFDGFR